MQIIKNDNFFMNLAINVARRNKGMTGANPSVGCVIVSRDKTIISIANTGIGGSPHAEKKALEGIEIKTGTVLYTTLEPCVHKGKNPPCVDEIINSGVKKVVIACLDKNPIVRGKGIKKLENSGIKVIKGVLEKDAEDFYDEFFKRINSNIPGINIKIASSADGKTALKNGKSKWITNKLSRNYGHKLRLFNDGIMVGINTVLKDNPSLTCRLSGLNKFSPSRLVMDTNLRFPINCNLAKTAKNIETIIFTSKNSSARKINLLKNKGIEIIKIPTTKSGLSLISALKFLGKREFNSILIEGGNKLIASAINSPQLNKIYWFSSEKIIGEEGKPSIGKLNITNLENSPNLFLHNMINLDNNYLKIYKAKN